jgi:hypothetical protein
LIAGFATIASFVVFRLNDDHLGKQNRQPPSEAWRPEMSPLEQEMLKKDMVIDDDFDQTI